MKKPKFSIGQLVYYYNDYPTKNCLMEVYVKNIINLQKYEICTEDDFSKIVRRNSLYKNKHEYELMESNKIHYQPIDINANIIKVKEANNMLIVYKCCETCKYIYKKSNYLAFKYCHKKNICLNPDGWQPFDCKLKYWELNKKIKEKYNNIKILSSREDFINIKLKEL